MASFQVATKKESRNPSWVTAAKIYKKKGCNRLHIRLDISIGYFFFIDIAMFRSDNILFASFICAAW